VHGLRSSIGCIGFRFDEEFLVETGGENKIGIFIVTLLISSVNRIFLSSVGAMVRRYSRSNYRQLTRTRCDLYCLLLKFLIAKCHCWWRVESGEAFRVLGLVRKFWVGLGWVSKNGPKSNSAWTCIGLLSIVTPTNKWPKQFGKKPHRHPLTVMNGLLRRVRYTRVNNTQLPQQTVQALICYMHTT